MIDLLRKLRHGPLRGLGPVWVRLGRLYRACYRRLGREVYVSKTVGGYGPFRLSGLFAFSDFENWGSGHNAMFRACVEACRAKSCVFDIGAHIGLVALPMSRAVAGQGRVFAFEPAVANRRLLAHHVRANRADNIEIVEHLVGDDERERVAFFEAVEPSGMNSLVPRADAPAYAETRKRQITLDGFCAARGLSPEVIKIDVEGAEIAVLEGARRTLGRCRPLVFLSVHPVHLQRLGHGPDDLTRLIAALSYRCLDLDGNPATALRSAEYLLRPN